LPSVGTAQWVCLQSIVSAVALAARGGQRVAPRSIGSRWLSAIRTVSPRCLRRCWAGR